MDLSKVLAELREELANLDAAIASLERLQKEGRGRGRPPKGLADARRSSRQQAESPKTSRKAE
jgi:hypothetical protein